MGFSLLRVSLVAECVVAIQTYEDYIEERIGRQFGIDSLEAISWGRIRSTLPPYNNADPGSLAAAIAESITHGAFFDEHVAPILPRFQEVGSTIDKMTYGVEKGDGTACSTQEQCDSIAAMMNMCSSIRSAASDAYRTFIAATNVLGTIMALLCGCIFVARLHFCVLSWFPYTCEGLFPFLNVLRRLPIPDFRPVRHPLELGLGNRQDVSEPASLQSAFRLSTLCNLYVDPASMSPIG